MTENRDDLAKPEGLSPAGERAWEIVVARLRATRLTSTGGCRAFYSPQEWDDRGEEYGRGAVLIVVYDGSDVGRAFDLERCCPGGSSRAADYDPCEGTWAALCEAGFHCSPCTGWYAAIYQSETV